MGQQRFDKPDDWEKIRQTWLFDDFVAYLDAFTFTKGTTGTGTTVAINSATANSWLNLGNAGSTAAAEAWFATTNKFWQWSANHPTHLITRINAQEANTNNLSIFAGYSSAFATGLVTTAVPPTLNTINSNMTAAGFFLPSGQVGTQFWYVASSVGTTQFITQTLEVAVPTVDQYLMVQADIVGTNVEVTYMVGNADTTGGADSAFPVGWQQCREAASGFNKPIKHRIAIGSAAAMSGGVYMKQQSTTAETVHVDFIGLLNLR